MIAVRPRTRVSIHPMHYVVTILFMLSPLNWHRAIAVDEVLPMPLHPLNSREGRKLLLDATAQEPFWVLCQNSETQQDLGSCSVASAVMVLNSLRVPAPEAAKIQPYRRHTAANLFSPNVEKITTAKNVSQGGMSLPQLHGVLQTFPVSCQVIYAGDVSTQQFSSDLQQHLTKEKHQVIVNYHRKTLGQSGGGHISPIAAYNDEAKMVLIADTASYKYPWTWVPVADLWRSMAEHVDGATGRTRGYLIVTTSDANAPVK